MHAEIKNHYISRTVLVHSKAHLKIQADAAGYLRGMAISENPRPTTVPGTVD